MVRIGKIHSIDSRSHSGTLVDTRGVEFFFSGYDCKADVIPEMGTIVTFIEDTDYRNTPVAFGIMKHDSQEAYAA